MIRERKKERKNQFSNNKKHHFHSKVMVLPIIYSCIQGEAEITLDREEDFFHFYHTWSL